MSNSIGRSAAVITGDSVPASKSCGDAAGIDGDGAGRRCSIPAKVSTGDGTVLLL
jgi:hypothetical protein